MVLDAVAVCLPAELRGALTPLAGGLSGAGVYRVDAGGRAYVLKLGSESVPVAVWRERLAIQQRAAAAGLAPRVIHHDEAHRAVVTEYVEHRRFVARLAAPHTRAAALHELGDALRRVHALPLPAGATWRDPRDLLAPLRAPLAAFAIPSFARSVLDRVLAEPEPPREHPLVTSHNDMNPSNLVLDGDRILFLDWDAAGANDPYFDLATVAVFLRFDDATAAALIAAHDAAPLTALPAGFVHARRFVAAVCATLFFDLARTAGHPGGEVPVERAPTLADVHGMIGIGALAPGSADGAWAFAQALVRTITDRAE